MTSRSRSRRATTSIISSKELRRNDCSVRPESLTHGASVPSEMAHNGQESAQTRRRHSRPTSQYGCIKSASDLPCFSKSQASTPSDGDSDIIEYQRPPIGSKREVSQGEEKLSPARGFLNRLLSLNRSRSRDRHKKGSQGAVETQHLLSSVSVAESLGRNDSNRKDSVDLKSDKLAPEIEVKVQHYCSLSRKDCKVSPQDPAQHLNSPLIEANNSLRPCPTPPLAIFSSDEDISAIPQTSNKDKSSAHALVGANTLLDGPKQLAVMLVDQAQQPVSLVIPEASQKTISPQLEQQISHVFSTPSVPDVPRPSVNGVMLRKHSLASAGYDTLGDTNILSISTVKRRPKYSRRKHYTIDFSSLPAEMISELDALDGADTKSTHKHNSMSKQSSLQALLCSGQPTISPDVPPDNLPNQAVLAPHGVVRAPSRPSSASRTRSSSRTRARVSPGCTDAQVPVLHIAGPSHAHSTRESQNRSSPARQLHNTRYCKMSSSQASLDQNTTCSRLARIYPNDIDQKPFRKARNLSESRDRKPSWKLSNSKIHEVVSTSQDSMAPRHSAGTSIGSAGSGPSTDKSLRHSMVLRSCAAPSREEDGTWDQVPLLMAEVASNDSGIQQDETPTSCESFKLQSHLENLPLIAPLRPTVESPRHPKRERPKSDCLTVRWADSPGGSTSQGQGPAMTHSPGGSTKAVDTINQVRRAGKSRGKERPKSDIGSFHGLSDTLQSLMRRDRINSSSSLLTPDGLSDSRHNIRSRRMSTPQPIRSRQVHSTSTRAVRTRPVVRRSRSAPDLADPEDPLRARARRQRDVFRMSSSTAGDLALQPHDYSSDDDSEDCVSYGAVSISGSNTSLRQHTTLDGIFEDHKTPTYTEALWDHVTMDTEELGFRAGDVIEVMDLEDRDWWFGQMGEEQGWFPAAFVRLRANQGQLVTDVDGMAEITDSTSNLALLATESVTQTQARTNVIKEILHAEREYVRHLKDVIQGYVEKCRKRPEMFGDRMMAAIFGNIGAIYSFSTTFLHELEGHVTHAQPHQSNIGKVFIKHSTGFEIYSEYCNNHPTACDELRTLTKNKKYTHFFEACRLLQDMIELPLEGFLLTPVQKICKYPLQLKELLKYTPPSHSDYPKLTVALETMRRIAVMINERKRKMESLEKLSAWQLRIEDWQGADLLQHSSELIYSGEMTKVNNSGWHQDRAFFLFDHQLIYCKKDMLWRDLLVYKGRINLDNCIIKALPDEKDPVFNIHVKNGIRIYDSEKTKWYLLYCRSPHDRARWFRAFQQERHCVEADADNDFNLEEFRRKVHITQCKGKTHPSVRYRERTQKRKKHRGHRSVHTDNSKPLSSLQSTPNPTQHDGSGGAGGSDAGHGKRWFNFGNKKNKR